MVRTVRQFEKDELREALRKAGEKAVMGDRAGESMPVAGREDIAAAHPDFVAPVEDAAEGSELEGRDPADPSDLKCERVQ